MEKHGKRLSVRWSEKRIEKLEELGWENKDDGDIIDDALDEAIRNK